ncbi:MAG: PKD domain-containing protein, partial [Dehalococcoidia bacterium]
ATQGYVSVDELRPGQGAWVLRHDSGAIFLGTAPRASGEAAVQTAQVTLSANPTDQGTFDTVSATTGEMVTTRQYDAAQAAADDLRAADDDGLRGQGGSTLPPLSENERADSATVREDLAKAKAANDAGDTATADAAVADAQVAAQASQDDAAAQTQQTAQALGVYEVAGVSSTTLTRFGVLARASFLGLALGVPLSPYYRALQSAVLTGSPLPPPPAGASTPTPTPTTSPAISVAAISCSATAVTAGSSVNCSAEVLGAASAVTWTAPGGNPSSGTGITFGSEFDSAGTYAITVQACAGNVCASKSLQITVSAAAQPSVTAVTPSAVVLNGSFSLTQQGGSGCNFSRAPQTGGTISFTVTLDSNGGTSGSLSGGGSGSMPVTCNGISSTMSWMQQYTAQFGGTLDLASGRLTMSGTLTGSQIITYMNCSFSRSTNSPTPGTCPSDTQPPSYSYPITVSGIIDIRSGTGGGTIVLSNIGLPTSGTWTAHE